MFRMRTDAFRMKISNFEPAYETRQHDFFEVRVLRNMPNCSGPSNSGEQFCILNMRR